ncbi:MAG: hypothetical protein IPK76_04775 [Lewinellaceae bacterium]|nr:hypothetical protein [Lewinellaceae bacterium]
MLRISADEVAFVHPTGGIVPFHTFRGGGLLIHALFSGSTGNTLYTDAIRRIAEAENRKFDVTIQPNGKSEEQFSVPVSRYRARDFKTGFTGRNRRSIEPAVFGLLKQMFSTTHLPRVPFI